jgi:hypothetical protein
MRLYTVTLCIDIKENTNPRYEIKGHEIIKTTKLMYYLAGRSIHKSKIMEVDSKLTNAADSIMWHYHTYCVGDQDIDIAKDKLMSQAMARVELLKSNIDIIINNIDLGPIVKISG